MSSDENDLLDGSSHRNERSRLSCQIRFEGRVRRGEGDDRAGGLAGLISPRMKAYHLTGSGPSLEDGLALLTLVTAATPHPQPGEVLLRQRAAGLNYVDLLYVDGTYRPPALPLVPLMDGAGEVVELGPGVTDFRVGDRVLPHALPSWLSGTTPAFGQIPARGYNLPGALAEYAVAPASALVPLPAHLSFEEAATLSIAGTTAWNVMRDGKVTHDSTVLVLGTGGVSLLALQFAKMLGARVIVTSSSDQKLEAARALGADEAINYATTPDWDVAVRDLTGGLGASLVVETVGTQTFTRSVNAAAKEGIIAAAGWRSGKIVSLPIDRVQQQRLQIIGGVVGSVADFRDMNAAITASGMRPAVAQVFEFGEAREAYRCMASHSGLGKVVIRI
jgi:NADPH:quinone reductase-like Zn-dependent oxidoreductase